MLAVGLSPEQQTAVTGGTAITGADLGTTSAPNFQRSTDTPPPDISGIDTTQKTATKLAPAEQKVSDLTKRITDIQSSLLGKTSFTAEQEGVAGLPELEKTQTDLAAQIRGYQLESQALQNQKVLAEERIQQDITGRGVTRAASSVMTAEAQRKITLQQADIASRALTASAMFEAIKGNIVTANSQIDRAVKAKFGAKEEELAVTIANLQIALQDPQLTLDEKKRAEAQLKIKEAENARNDAKKQEQTDIWNVGLKVAPNLAKVPNGSLILDEIQKAKTKEEALRLATPYLAETEEVKLPADIQTFKSFFPNVDITTPAGQQQFLNWEAKVGAAGRKGEDTGTKLLPEDKRNLIGSGLNDAMISNIEEGVRTIGIDEVLKDDYTDTQKVAIRKVYGIAEKTKLTRESVAKLYGLTDDDTKTGFWGFGKTNKTKLDEIMAIIERYQAVGVKDDEILKLIQK